jgi:alanine racemase
VLYKNLQPIIAAFLISHHRDNGSNGKTIVKEWFLLSPDYNIIRSPKSYNSQIGVPLSVIAINEQHNLGIF